MATRYATKTDLINEFGDANVANWFDYTATTSLTTTENTYIDEKINYAEDLIDDMLSSIATTPFTGATLTAMSSRLKTWTCHIAAYLIYTRPGVREGDRSVAKVWYDFAIDAIKFYVGGTANLPTAAGTVSLITYGHQGTESTTADDFEDKDFRQGEILT